MHLFIGFLTFVLVMTSLFLILLVLVQLPKKDAGVGMAFGAGMSEMLLGAGSGNVLTRITKYTVGIFLGVALLMSVLISRVHRQDQLGVTRALEEQARALPPAAAPAAPSLQSLATPTNLNLLATPGGETGAPATPVPAPAPGTESTPADAGTGTGTTPLLITPPVEAPATTPETSTPAPTPTPPPAPGN